ncbi:MAG: hypothetical protein ACKOUS_03975 [Alphaproteobacteria bacterium]
MRRRDVICTGLAGAALAACATPAPPEPLVQLADSRLLVVAPAADFDPARLPPGWSRHGDRAARISVNQEAGRSVLSFDAPGGDTILRRIDAGLVTTPVLHWHWKLEAAAFEGTGDGLPRGLRIVVGLDGGGSPALIQPSRWMRWGGGLPDHQRRIEVSLAGAGAARRELALLELAATAEDGTRRVLRPAAQGLTGGWIAESVDLLALYRDFFPRDSVAMARISFLALGATPARLPEAAPQAIGHVVEVQLFR